MKEHAARYPLMRPCDAVKLIYQNEFGGGHLVYDKGSAKAYFMREYEMTKEADISLFEDIGNDLARLNLAALNKNRVSADEAFERFYVSSMQVRGRLESFKRKLSVLVELTGLGGMPFSAVALDDYLNDYIALGYPMVSHSDEYREAYHPAYRVVKMRYLISDEHA